MKKIVLVFFLFIFWFNNSKAQCGGILSIAVSPNDTVCEGTSVNIISLLSNGGVGWDFKIYQNSIIAPNMISDTTSAIITSSTSTIYYVIADSNGCTRKIDSINLTVKSSPPVHHFICKEDTIIVTPYPSYISYQWFLNSTIIQGAIDSFFIATQSGNYSVEITDSSSCSRLVDVPTLCFTAGINTNTDQSNISVYPNPLTSSSTLQFNTQLKDAEVIIYDMLGKEMMRKRFTGNEMKIEKGNLESGVYFVKVIAGEKQWVQKLIVE